MRILLTGAAGLIGREIHHYFSTKGHHLIPVDVRIQHTGICLDLTQARLVRQLVAQHQPDLIIHLAAMKDIKLCETNKRAAHRTNYGITTTLADICKASQIRLIYFSTDYVFGKQDQFWEEHDPLCPTTQYGIDKAKSEQYIQAQLTNYAIIRTAQLYGFSGDFVSLVWKTLRSNQVFKAISNLINCPTWIQDLLAMLDQIIHQAHQGIFHCVGPAALSRYQYAFEIAQTFGLNTNLIQPITLDFTQDIRPPIVRINGSSTYQKLQVYPHRLKNALPTCKLYLK
ncbi:MAG: SDR family oxidoreductase [Flammeovirgaceae bacterium]